MAKCEDCRHKHICKHAEKYSQYQKEMQVLKEKWLDYNEEIFTDSVNCTYYEVEKVEEKNDSDQYNELIKALRINREKNKYNPPIVWY